ncbi:hypothetical protein ACUR5C_14700 [Aliikangiella sp. IMCC44653]
MKLKALFISLLFCFTLSTPAVMAENTSAADCKDCKGLSKSRKKPVNKRFKNSEIYRLCTALSVGFNYYNVRLRLEDIKKTHGFTNEELIQYVMIDSYCEREGIVRSVAGYAMFNELDDFKVLEEYGFNDTYKIDGGDGIKKIPSQIAKEQIRNYVKKPIILRTLSYIRRIFKGSK